MKILKARNGIALSAVLIILLITSLFIPVMFSMSESSLLFAVKSEDRQRANYFARSVTEMSVAAFKVFDSDEYTRLPAEARASSTLYTDDEKAEKNKIIAAYEDLLNPNNARKSIVTQDIAMLVKDNGAQEFFKIEVINGVEIKEPISYKEYKELEVAYIEMTTAEPRIDPGYKLIPEAGTYLEQHLPNDIVYANKPSDDYDDYITEGYTEIGLGNCEITYDDKTTYYKTKTSTQETEEIIATKDKTAAQIYKDLNDQLDTALANASKDPSVELPEYSLSKVENRNLNFKSTVTVNGFTASKTCVLVLQTYPSEEEWFVFGVSPKSDGKKIPSGGNQIFVDPSKATSRVPIEYSQAITSGYLKQTLLVFSSVGNMLIQPTKFKDVNNSNSLESTGVNNSQFVLGVQPGLNTTPNDDPNYEIIDAVNYNNSKEVAEMNNFVAFTSTSGIKVDMPINLLVNPCRANRAGDNKILQTVPNGSLYKLMIFQAPVIQFNGRLDMMMSFYQRGTEEARRMSSVVLSAPESTPYSFRNAGRNDKVVKAGMVYFTEDCYLWIIPYGEDGSSSSWTGVLSETVYKRDSDFTKVKIANAGDVYLFNAEMRDTSGNDIGFSLTGYFIETEYIPNLNQYEKNDWWQVWDSVRTSFFRAGMLDYIENNQVYVEEDFHYIGNVFDDESNIKQPELDEYYTYWLN